MFAGSEAARPDDMAVVIAVVENVAFVVSPTCESDLTKRYRDVRAGMTQACQAMVTCIIVLDVWDGCRGYN